MEHINTSTSHAGQSPYLGSTKHDDLTFSGRVYRWYAAHLEILARLDKTDARAILGWQYRALENGATTFGLQCPTSMIVTSAGGHLAFDQGISPAYCALREGLRQRDAVRLITSKLALNDDAWCTLLNPILGSADIGTPIEDTALLILLDQHFGNAGDAVWRVILTWHHEQIGSAPGMTRAQFDRVIG